MSSNKDVFRRYLEEVRERLSYLAGKLKFALEDENIIGRFSPTVLYYYNNAIQSFLTSSYLASVLTSSASVEVAINSDERMQELRGEMRKWLNLNVRLLRRARKRDLPIDKLLIQGDSLEQGNVWFVVRRNKFAHGEIYLPTDGSRIPALIEKDKAGYVKAIRLSYRPETMALQQLMSAHEFLKALYA